MFKIDSSTAATVLPTPGSPGVNPNGFFTTGTTITVDWLNAVQEEICYVITQSGATLSKTDRTQLYTAIQQIITDAGAGITALVEDTSPQLGGDLDVNGFKIIANTGDVVLQSTSGIINLNAPTVTVPDQIVHFSDATNKIVFGASSQDYQIGGTSIFDLSASGFRIGGTGARVTTIDNDVTMAANSATRLATQAAIKGYVDAFVPSPGPSPNKINFFGSATATFAAASTWYFANNVRTSSAPGSTDDTKYACFYITGAYTINNLMVGAGTAPGTGFTYTFTVYKNGSSTSLTATISDTSKYASDTTHSFTVVAGDVICVQLVVSAGATNASLGVNWSVLGTSP